MLFGANEMGDNLPTTKKELKMIDTTNYTGEFMESKTTTGGQINCQVSPHFNSFSAILINILGVDEKDITPESQLIDDFGVDSLDIVELIIETESVFGISIKDEEAEKMRTVKDCINYLDNRLSG